MPTGLPSFDWAIGGGLPLRSIIEISGWEWSGKTTLALYLSALVNPQGFIGYADIEPMQDISYVKRMHQRLGFKGTMRFPTYGDKEGVPTPSEVRLNELCDMLYEPKLSAAVIDSVGAIYTVAQEEGKVGEARVAERARIMSGVMDKLSQRLNTVKSPAIGILTNHAHPIIGGRGVETSGGVKVRYLSATRIRLSADRSEDGLWVSNGKITKRRHWGEVSPPDVFQIAIVPGQGVHPGLTAVVDCLTYKLATKDRTISLNGKSYGFLSKLVEQQADDDLFRPFQEALTAYAQSEG